MTEQQSTLIIEDAALLRPLVEITDLTKSYTTGTVTTAVLKGITMPIGQGEIVVILGPSGSGKTTLLNIIGGIDRGDRGQVVVGGTAVSSLDDKRLTEYRRAQVGFVFQFYNLVPNLTVGENIEVVANISKTPLATAEVLAAVGMADKQARFPRELSGGEQQRVSIARAVVKNPQLLLCDEPTGALDYETAHGILRLLQEVNRCYGTTIVMVTHNTAIAAMAHRVFKLRSGEIVETVVNQTTVPAERIEW
jgi:putative ABC transport system ATP-binding protein